MESAGLFSKPHLPECCISLKGKVNSFYIGFSSVEAKKKWLEYIEWAVNHNYQLYQVMKSED